MAASVRGMPRLIRIELLGDDAIHHPTLKVGELVIMLPDLGKKMMGRHLLPIRAYVKPSRSSKGYNRRVRGCGAETPVDQLPGVRDHLGHRPGVLMTARACVKYHPYCLRCVAQLRRVPSDVDVRNHSCDSCLINGKTR